MNKKIQNLLMKETCGTIKQFLHMFNDIYYKYDARSYKIVPLEYFPMSKSCLTYLVTSVVWGRDRGTVRREGGVGSGRISDGVKNDQNFKCSLEPREHSPKIF